MTLAGKAAAALGASAVVLAVAGCGRGNADPSGTLKLALSNVSASAITSNGATITWSTNLLSQSAVQYGLTPNYGTTTSLQGLTTGHEVPVTGLSPGTLYHCRAISLDPSTSTAVSSGDVSFMTLCDGGTLCSSCAGVTCGGHGTCDASTGTAACNCDPGYAASGLVCSCASGSCDAGGGTGCDGGNQCSSCAGVTCGGHGTCDASTGTAACNCDPGYAASGLVCSCASGTCDAGGSTGCIDPIPGAVFDDEFNTLDTGTHGSGTTWAYSDWWSPNGSTVADLASWQVNPEATGLPVDANTYSVNGGVLRMEVKNTPADVPGSLVSAQPYLGSWLETYDSFHRTYGYFEARMQAESGDCLTSAFWMIPEDGSWPPEIDMPEFDTFQPTLVDWGIQDGPNNSNAQSYPIWEPFDVSSGMHVYAVDWEPDDITFYVDGVQSAQQPTPADHDKDMFLILDIMARSAGVWGCQSGSPGNIDQSLYVDYVRVYPSSPYSNGATNSDWSNHSTAQQVMGSQAGCQ